VGRSESRPAGQHKRRRKIVFIWFFGVSCPARKGGQLFLEKARSVALSAVPPVSIKKKEDCFHLVFWVSRLHGTCRRLLVCAGFIKRANNELGHQSR
jgi:hypothetical protein